MITRERLPIHEDLSPGLGWSVERCQQEMQVHGQCAHSGDLVWVCPDDLAHRGRSLLREQLPLRQWGPLEISKVTANTNASPRIQLSFHILCDCLGLNAQGVTAEVDTRLIGKTCEASASASALERVRELWDTEDSCLNPNGCLVLPGLASTLLARLALEGIINSSRSARRGSVLSKENAYSLVTASAGKMGLGDLTPFVPFVPLVPLVPFILGLGLRLRLGLEVRVWSRQGS